jgi:hypothetical protein
MQNQTIVQKRLWVSKEFRLEDGILYYKHVGLFGGFAVELRYEDIESEKRVEHKRSFWLLAAATILMYLSITNIFSGVGIGFIGALLAGGIYYMVDKLEGETLCFDTQYDTKVAFLRDEKYKEETDKFVDEFLRARKLFLVEKYWDCVENYDQKINNLDWLKNCNVVNIDEFKYLTAEYFEQAEGGASMPIGFKKSA